jgi:hypothetical protein
MRRRNSSVPAFITRNQSGRPPAWGQLGIPAFRLIALTWADYDGESFSIESTGSERDHNDEDRRITSGVDARIAWQRRQCTAFAAQAKPPTSTLMTTQSAPSELFLN